MLKPTLVSVGILETMWVWNDYLLPYLVLDGTKYMTTSFDPSPVPITPFCQCRAEMEAGLAALNAEA